MGLCGAWPSWTGIPCRLDILLWEIFYSSPFQSSTEEYTNTLTLCCEYLKEVIGILGPIRVDSEEGANGLKVITAEI